MKLKNMMLLVFLCLNSILNAQSNFKKGFVITNSNDTIQGEIDYRGDISMNKKCRFKNGDNLVTYTPDDISAYKFIDGKYFVSKNFQGEKSFFEFLIKGQVSIYFHKNLKGRHYYIEKDGLGIRKITYEENLKYQGDKIYSYGSTKHIGIFNIYMQDAPSLKSRISRLKELSHKSLIKLATDYNNIVCGEGVCLAYKKKSPTIKVNIEVAGGKVNRLAFIKTVPMYELGNNNIPLLVNHKILIDEEKYYQYGIYAHIWLPRLNEKLYLRTGYLSNKHGYKIPLQLEYVFPKWKIKPKLAYGINILKPFKQTVGAMLGFNIDFHKNVGLSFNYDLDFEADKTVIIPSEKTHETLSLGLILKL
ncbi:hypothetical protein DWB61_02730 [Ancylomarina euxinus]|uniref:Outer membrane protein beta-barrel domain-containing protein n=1 Tax=Ancylomarina euxinus TaxID=2283627 RepID=A0A425Y6E9_9BACT|nr:hypothetical protein [Ancylomarina euxinus]MCZ4694082.1 hypothetical protein [Ancylomarina euxinus]MUP15747.1 hypothetical protein [Ancylomarina euxinus]RRG24048.1 hypothetical protein DWB61_02730 [Ancylomarina euxinus]